MGFSRIAPGSSSCPRTPNSSTNCARSSAYVDPPADAVYLLRTDCPSRYLPREPSALRAKRWLRKKEQWLDHAQAMIEATSVAKAAERCHVHPTTAFRWRHRFLGSPALDKPKTLTGIVEADETFILESFKGRRSELPRPPRKRGGKAKHPGLFFENIPILVGLIGPKLRFWPS